MTRLILAAACCIVLGSAARAEDLPQASWQEVVNRLTADSQRLQNDLLNQAVQAGRLKARIAEIEAICGDPCKLKQPGSGDSPK